MTWTPELHARLKALRKEATTPGVALVRAIHYHDELAVSDPIAEIERLQRIIAGIRDWLDDHSDVEDGEGEDARPMPNWAMRGLQELEALEAQRG